MTTQQSIYAIDRLRDFGVEIIAFCGGEPLCRADLLEVAHHAKSRGIYIALVTNGTLITEEMVPQLTELFDMIWVSLDSHVREEHELLRGKGSFEPTMQAVRLLARHRPKNFVVNSVVCKANYRSMPEMKKLLLDELGIDDHRAVAYVPTSSLRERNQVLLGSVLDDESMGFLEEAGVQVTLAVDELPPLEINGRDGLLVKKANHRIHCGAASGDIHMVSNGDIYPCVMMYKRGFCGGNILRSNIEDIYLHSDAMEACRGATVDSTPECADCAVKYVCAGGCRALAYDMYGDLRAHHKDLCGVLKKSAFDALWADTVVPLDRVRNARQSYKQKLEGMKANGRILGGGLCR